MEEAAAQQHCSSEMPCTWKLDVNVLQVIRDSAAFPSPVIALGSQHTVNDAIVADHGTVLQLAGWTAIYDLEERRVLACGPAPAGLCTKSQQFGYASCILAIHIDLRP